MSLACSPLDNITGIPGACCAHMSHCGWSSCDLGQLDAGGELRVLDALWTAPASLKQEECIAGVRAKATHVLRLEIVECGRAENKIKVTRVTSRAAADL